MTSKNHGDEAYDPKVHAPPMTAKVSFITTVEVLETGIEDAAKAALLIEEGAWLKARLDKNIGDADYDPKVHIARRYEEVRMELTAIQVAANQDALRHNGVVFKARLQEGRETTDAKKFHQELLQHGVKADVIADALEAAKKRGDPFWVKEFEIL